MTPEPTEITDARRALGERLAAFRKVAAMTQDQLARAVFCDRTTVVHVERGRRSADERFWLSADTAVAAGGALLADFHAVQTAKAAHQQRQLAEAVAAARTRATTELARAPEPVPVGGGGIALHDVEVAADESNEFLAWAEDENVGELTLEQMQAEVRRISHAYLKVPTGPLFARTRALRDRAFTLLHGQQRPAHARELYTAAGWALTMLAWMSVDFGRPAAGEDHARTAWLCAERADHDGLRAWVRATQHTAAFWQRDFERAATYAADGLRYATGSATIFLASAYALDLARSGRADQAARALADAQRSAESADHTADELAGPFTCSTERAGGFWSDTQLAIGAAQPALEHADRAVAAFEAAPPSRRNAGSERMARLQQVRAHLTLDQLDGAETTLTPVLNTPAELRAWPLMQRMQDVLDAATADSHHAKSVATRISAAVTAFQHETPRPELTT